MSTVFSLEEQESEIHRLEKLLRECMTCYEACVADEEFLLEAGNLREADYAHRESVRFGREIRELRSRIEKLKTKTD